VIDFDRFLISKVNLFYKTALRIGIQIKAILAIIVATTTSLTCEVAKDCLLDIIPLLPTPSIVTTLQMLNWLDPEYEQYDKGYQCST